LFNVLQGLLEAEGSLIIGSKYYTEMKYEWFTAVQADNDLLDALFVGSTLRENLSTTLSPTPLGQLSRNFYSTLAVLQCCISSLCQTPSNQILFLQ
jgi:hypothetical protein